jgi:hypothetical protein
MIAEGKRIAEGEQLRGNCSRGIDRIGWQLARRT